MSNIKNRLARLEERRLPPRLLVVFSGGASDAEVRSMLERDHGIRPAPADQIVHFATIYEDEDGNPLPDQAPPHYVPMTPPAVA